jgi:pimeloyl-ACP methyl ester carboxylesterase
VREPDVTGRSDRWSRVAVGAGALLLVVAAVVGWRLVSADPAYDAHTPLADQCHDVPEGAERVAMTRDGVTLGGAMVGAADARVGVVLRQGAGQTICDWLPWAGVVAHRTGARVLLFDRRGAGSSAGPADLTAEPGDLADAVALLHRQGARRVAVVGASMGSSVTFAALDSLRPAPCALVAISPVLLARDSNGTVDGRAADRYPPNLWLTWEEQNPAIVADVDHIRARARDRRDPAPHLHGVDTHDHSIRLVEDHGDVRAFLLDAIRSCTDRRQRATG